MAKINKLLSAGEREREKVEKTRERVCMCNLCLTLSR